MTTPGEAPLGAAPESERVIVLAPLGRDGALAQHVASSVGLCATVCTDVAMFRDESRRGAGALLLTEDALSPGTVQILQELLSAQPPWSDLAVIICATQGEVIEGRLGIIEKLRTTANVSLLERPVRKWMLATSLVAAVRARRRQYEMRDLYQERSALLERERTARATAESASRAKDDFLAMVSHELRTPLNAMLGWTKLLRSGVIDARQQAHALEVVERNAEAQRRLVEQLIDVSRALANEFRLTACMVSLRGIVESALDSVKPSVEAKGLHLDYSEPVQDVCVVGDPQRLLQVVSNLLGNAVKFTPRDGKITARLTREGPWAVIEVTDTGDGISPEFLPHVFERFRQADTSRTRQHGGLGLGLSIARTIVELHGGEVEARSEGKGRGARFVVRLPYAQRGGAPTPPMGTRQFGLEPVPQLKDVRALVVDDDDEARDLVAFVLRSCGLRVRTASNAAEAIAQIRAERPEILLSDIAMPGKDGYALLEEVRRLEGGRKIPAVAITAYAGAADRQRALDAGYDAHVAKPIDFAELLAALGKLRGSVDDRRDPSEG